MCVFFGFEAAVNLLKILFTEAPAEMHRESNIGLKYIYTREQIPKQHKSVSNTGMENKRCSTTRKV